MGDKNRVYYGEYTLKHWIDLMLTEDIVLPDYQRYFVWDDRQAKLLIDSFRDDQWNIVKRMDTFFKYISMERQNYACLSI